jgi:hypothetical protein
LLFRLAPEGCALRLQRGQRLPRTDSANVAWVSRKGKTKLEGIPGDLTHGTFDGEAIAKLARFCYFPPIYVYIGLT